MMTSDSWPNSEFEASIKLVIDEASDQGLLTEEEEGAARRSLKALLSNKPTQDISNSTACLSMIARIELLLKKINPDSYTNRIHGGMMAVYTILDSIVQGDNILTGEKNPNPISPKSN